MGLEHEITVFMEDGDVSFKPERKKVKRGDAVHWVSPDGPFSIEFTKDTPSTQSGASGHSPNPPGWKSETLGIRDDARGRYPYIAGISLPVRSGEQYGRVALVAGCPEIIVE